MKLFILVLMVLVFPVCIAVVQAWLYRPPVGRSITEAEFKRWKEAEKYGQRTCKPVEWR